MSCAPLVPASRECHPLPLVGLRKIGKVGGRSMPPFTVLFARLSTLSLLSALLVMGLSPGAPGVQAYGSRATGLHAQATNPAISLTGSAGPEGYSVAVSGSGFAPNRAITLLFDGSTVSTSCSTKGDGSFRYCTFTVPAAGPGTHAVTASDYNANSASTGFVLNPGISLTPSRGPVGSGAAVGGSGFAPNSRITVTLDDHHVSTACQANAVGSFSNCAFTVPDASPGAHIVTARDYSGNAPILRFYHSAMASYSVTPGASLDPEAGIVGRPVRGSGGNFQPHRILRVSFDGSRRPTTGDCPTRGSGNLPASHGCTSTRPTEAPGSHNLTVTDRTYSYTTAYTVQPGVSLSFDEGAVGSAVAVSGSGYSSLRSVFLDFGDSRVALTTSAGTACTTGASGSFNCGFHVPDATAGSHNVTAMDDNGFSDATHFNVTPSVDLPSSSGPVGGRTSVTGDGFKAKDTITVTFADQKISTDCTTDRNGNLGSCGFTVPEATVGTYKVAVSDGAHSAWTLYAVTPGGLSLNLTAGVVGSAVMLNGSNYTPNSTLAVRFDGSKVSTSGICTTDAKGNLPATNNCAFTIPATSAGPHAVTVSDGTYSGSATYTVNTALSVTPEAGPVASAAAVSGSAFAPYSPIKVTVGDSHVDTACATDAKGNLSYCAFTVPDMHVGTRTVTVKDGSGYSAAASFTVEPAISLNLPAGAVGSTITLSGSNYKAGGSLSVKFDSEELSTSCKADSSGNVSGCAFTVPAATAGDHTVKVSDGTYTGTASYTVGPSLRLIRSGSRAP